MAVERERLKPNEYEREYSAILKVCSDFGFSDTDDVPLSAIVRSAFQTLRAAVASPLSLTPPEARWIEVVKCARCHAEIKDGGMCGYGCDLDGELRDARSPADVVSERYALVSTRKWSEEITTPAAPALSLTGLREQLLFLLNDVYLAHRDRDAADSDWEFKQGIGYTVDVPCDWCVKAEPVIVALASAPQPASSGLRELVEKLLFEMRACLDNPVRVAGSDYTSSRIVQTWMDRLVAALRAATGEK